MDGNKLDFSVSEKTKYPSEQVLIIGITLIFWTSQFWCSIAMIIGACGILTTLLSVASWGYLFGFLFYLSLFLTEVIDEFRFRTVFTFAFVGKFDDFSHENFRDTKDTFEQ